MQWLLNGPSNRWSDKTLQIVNCENGLSGTVAEHSMVDGGTLQQLSEHVRQRHTDHSTLTHLTNGSSHLTSGHHPFALAPFSELTVTLTAALQPHIARIQTSYTTLTTPLACEVSTLTLASVSGALFRTHGVPPKALGQLAIQLAARLYFRHSPEAWETLSMRAFRKGRI